MKKIMYNMALEPAGNRIRIIKVEMQKDETAKILRVIFDNKLGKLGYRQYKKGDFHRFPPDTYMDQYKVVKLIFDKIGWLINL